MKTEQIIRHYLMAPYVVPPQYVDEPVPENIKTKITEERLLNKGKEEATDTEAMYYISKMTLMYPLNNEWYKIYMYLFQKFAKSMNIDTSNILDKEFALECNEKEELLNLKKWIYKSQKEHLKKKFGKRRRK